MKWTCLFIFLFSVGVADAQKIAGDCPKLLAEVDSLAKSKHYEKALVPWTDLRKKCPTYNAKVYTLGFDILKFKVDRTPADKREAEAKELIKLYDDYNKFYPKNTEPVSVYKALAMSRYNIGTNEEIYELLDKAFTKSPEKFKDPEALYQYFKLFVETAKSDKTILPKDVLAKHDAFENHLQKLTLEFPENKKANGRYSQTMDRLVSNFENCESLSKYYAELFESRKTDTIWLSIASRKLMEKQCVSDPIFETISSAQYKLKPSSQAAYNLGTLALKKGKTDEAVTYFKLSADLAKKAEEKAEIYYTIASRVYTNDKGNAKIYAMKAVEVKRNFSKSYVFLAQLYASASECAKTDFEKKALNLLAAETIRKAIESDKKMTDLNKTLNAYLEKAPTNDEIKKAKMSGKTVTFACWINESVAVPKN